jgi:hypothetical protein
MTAEQERLLADAKRTANWKRWGPYLSERQWATVREDYSPEGACWDYFPHDQARCRAYRWGEDGLLGITDRECRLCFALALWNGKDPILKERLFGLTGPEGNHGEDVKEQYFYLDSTPTHSYLKALYKYPQTEFPYARLIEENRRRSKVDPEFELTDTGVFDDHRYFDVFAEYAKYSPDDILIRLTVANRSSESATLHLLPTLWFRNTWTWKCAHEGVSIKPQIRYDREKPPRCLSRIAWEFLSGPRRKSRRQTAAGAIHGKRNQRAPSLEFRHGRCIRKGRLSRVYRSRTPKRGKRERCRHKSRSALYRPRSSRRSANSETAPVCRERIPRATAGGDF